MDRNKFDEQFEKAKRAGGIAERIEPRATYAHFDAATRSIVIQLRGDGTFSFPVDLVEGLAGAGDVELSRVEITPDGEGLHWAGLDIDLSVPGLVEGRFGPHPMPEWFGDEADDLLNMLYAEIETAWNSRRDDGCVDRLAREHPNLAGALYSFFTVLIESDLSGLRREVSDPDSAERIRRWLDEQGFRLAADSVKDQRSNSSISPEGSPGEPSRAARSGPMAGNGTDEGPPPFLRWLTTSTGFPAQEVAEILQVTVEFLMLVPQNIDIVPAPVRDELAKRAEVKLNLDVQEARSSLNQPYHHRKAALRDKPYPTDPLTFDSLLKISGLKAPDRRYWKKVAEGKV
jgi:hypothetical protein